MITRAVSRDQAIHSQKGWLRRKLPPADVPATAVVNPNFSNTSCNAAEFLPYPILARSMSVMAMLHQPCETPVRATTLPECLHGITDAGEKSFVQAHESQVVVIRYEGFRANPSHLWPE